MQVNKDYEELFKILNAYSIKYLVVGGYAVMYYTEPRYTKDIDIWIIPDLNDVQKVFEALKKFGAPLQGVSPGDFMDKHMIYQIGVPPIRIDIMVNVPGIDFAIAWKNRKKVKYGKTSICILGKQELKLVKEKAARPQDGLDLQKLRKFEEKK